MAVIKAISSKSNIKRIINYVTQDKKTNAALITGKDCMAESCLEEMQYVKELYKKNNGRQYIHLIQSFSPDDKASKEEIHKIGLKLAELFVGHQVLIATHMDREHLHNHLVINSVAFEDGRKFQMSKKDLEAIKDFSDNLCREANLSVIEKTDKSTYINTKQYGVAQRGESWKFRLINAIDNSMANSNTKDEFIKNMNSFDYKVNWTDTRKYITYTTPEGMKCRDNKLYDKKYLKQEMEIEYGKFKREKSDSERNTSSTTNSNNAIYISRANSISKSSSITPGSCTRYSENKKYSRNGAKVFSDNTGENGEPNERYSKSNDKIRVSGHQEEYGSNRGTAGENQYKNKMEIKNNRLSSGAFSILDIFSNQRVSNRPRRNIKGYRGSLSKQAMKEWSIKHANASSINWEEEEESL